MLFSQRLKSSAQCLPSPDGSHIATLFASVVNVRAVRGLEVVNVVKLPPDFAGPVLSFSWSPSSRLLLVAGVDQIHVVSALDTSSSSFHATIRNPVAPGTRPAFVGFGTSDAEICVLSSFGLKFAVYDLASSKATEIASPKFFSPSAACRCFSFRPQTRHLALLTRVAGKDMLSIHGFPARELQRSWAPDTVDAQGVVWSPDGRWLVVWDSPAQGHRVLFYTPDGQVFKSWSGPASPPPKDRDYAVGAGVKFVQFSADGRHLAIGDCSRSLCVLGMASVTEALRLQHPSSLVPRDTLQVWQEQIGISHAGPSIHTFLRTAQVVSPAPRPQDSSEPLLGFASIAFDPSSALVATRLEDYPSTAWVWDTQVAELRAVLLFHGNVRRLSWHPNIPETLLIVCEGDQYNGIVFVWDPLSEGPRSVEFSQHFSGPSSVRALWLGLDASSPPSLFLSDSNNYLLASLVEADQDSPWGNQVSTQPTSAARREESPLELVPAVEANLDPGDSGQQEDDSELEDTFLHKQ
ncbi:hypothetical protein B0T24DRAFT_675194 [Lasiosphaeria ovina]|uniref:WD40 domain-containing protein n=1 Tax=Lasiosphaeria ovina TaxID=92902 RepID=A0AAE0KMV8_9PEZI|nr:hypothetical protein B0T24DRAFT_675194 [Lasiosphaeria ovina]